MTLGEALAAGRQLLQEHRVPSPARDAAVLLAHCLGVDGAYLHAHLDADLSTQVQLAYRANLERRCAREPLQYITGTQEFYGRGFRVNPSVLIPRPETEFVIETVCRLNQWSDPAVLDIGTGSGCIAVTLALEIPGASVFAGDLAADALITARDNARTLEAPVRFACVDGLAAWNGGFEFIVSNPPYVLETEKPGLQPEVRDHEPHLALFGQEDPIQFYTRLFAAAHERLKPGGYVVVEIGYSMEGAVRRTLEKGWRLQDTVTDLGGIRRVLAARKPEDSHP